MKILLCTLAFLLAAFAHAQADENKAAQTPQDAVESVTLDGDEYRVRWFAKEDFEKPDWVLRWVVEGTSEVDADEKLWVRAKEPGEKNTATIWYRPELPQNVIVRFRAAAVGRPETNAANLNLFLHAKEEDGSPIRFGRSGDYKEYHTFPNYIVTFVGGIREGWSRARRNPGFGLLHEAPVCAEIDREYDIAVTCQDGRLRYYIDGKRIHDVTDPDPLPGGRFAIRTWSTDGWWDDVEFGELLEGEE